MIARDKCKNCALIPPVARHSTDTIRNGLAVEAMTPAPKVHVQVTGPPVQEIHDAPLSTVACTSLGDPAPPDGATSNETESISRGAAPSNVQTTLLTAYPLTVPIPDPAPFSLALLPAV